MPVILCMIGLISHFILYSALKNKYNFEISIFLHGVGFTSCCVALVWIVRDTILLSGSLGVGIEQNLWLFYMLPFTSLYYSYATLLQNIEKKNKVTLCLIAITAVSFAVLMIFEIIKIELPYMSIFPALFGLHLAYCYKKGTLNLRKFIWVPFLPFGIVFLWMLVWGIFAYIITNAF